MDPKIFLKALLRQYILILREERAPKKRDFLGTVFQKVPKNSFFGLFFQSFVFGAENFVKIGKKTMLLESSKNQFGRPKKRVDKIFENFLESRSHPREIPRSAPDFF